MEIKVVIVVKISMRCRQERVRPLGLCCPRDLHEFARHIQLHVQWRLRRWRLHQLHWYVTQTPLNERCLTLHLLDINECDRGLCSPNAVCVNYEPGFNCTCTDGYEGDGLTCTGNVSLTWHQAPPYRWHNTLLSQTRMNVPPIRAMWMRAAPTLKARSRVRAMTATLVTATRALRSRHQLLQQRLLHLAPRARFHQLADSLRSVK